MRSEGFWIRQKGILVAIGDRFEYLSRADLCYWNNMEEFQQAFHIAILREDTNQLTYHDPVYVAFQERDMQAIHKNFLLEYYLAHQLSTTQSRLAKRDHLCQRRCCLVSNL